MLLSFCTTCKNRLYQLRETLPENLQQTAGKNVQFVLVNYNSEDGLDEWVQAHCMEAIESGRLLYAHAPDKRHFHASKAKNLAHRLADGDVLFNLDADNYVADSVEVIERIFNQYDDVILHLWMCDMKDGTFGRIALPKEWFYRLGGYDETFHPMTMQDVDLLSRARLMGMRQMHIRSGKAIINDKRASVRFTGSELNAQQMIKKNRERSFYNMREGRLRANPDGFEPVRVILNFSEERFLHNHIPTLHA